MFRSLLRLALDLAAKAVLILPIAIAVISMPETPRDRLAGRPDDGLRDMRYGPEEIVYILPERTPVRFGELLRMDSLGPWEPADLARAAGPECPRDGGSSPSPAPSEEGARAAARSTQE